MISHNHKCIFVHIPKTGGQSVENVFLSMSGLSWDTRAPLLLRRNSNPQAGPPRLAHLTAREYVKCSHISEKLFNLYFKFSFVRNPWCRILSEFKWRRHTGAWVSWLMKMCSVKDADKFNDGIRHIKPQYDFLFDENGNQLVDFIGKFENFQEDFNIVCDKVGIPCQELPHKNKSKHKHYTEYYDDETRELVAKKYAKDIEYFGYKFGED